jgi:hypothetical protein
MKSGDYGESPGFFSIQTINPNAMTNLFSQRIARTLLITSLLLSTRMNAQQVAPVYPPQGGFHIEGDLRANTPIINAGDWISGPSGSGGQVLNLSGVPLDTATTIHVVDLWNSSNDDYITGQANDNPNTTWAWGTGNVPAKTDLNNVLIHFTSDSIGCHKWMMFAADRWGSVGTSYVDFELLQNTLTRNINGTFTSAGPQEGRTVNDLLITVQYTNGGSQANIDFYKWDTISPGVYDYVQFIPPNASRYGFTSSGGESVPYMAFGDTNYLTNQFVEGMLDLDAIVQAYLTTLSSIVFKTITVKTKVSAALSAVCVDMIAPVQINNLTLDCWLIGIEENPWQNAISISPNPAHNDFTISISPEFATSPAQLCIYNIVGEKVYSTTINSKLQTLNPRLPGGIYVVRVREGSKQFTQKLVID